ncbi:MAG: phosphatase PAP2 family protein [Croceibacterium sp.]
MLPATIRAKLGREQRLLLGLIAALLLAWGFGALGGEVTDGETSAFDKKIELFFRHSDDLARTIGPDWLRSAAIDLTALGSETILTLVAVAGVAFLLLRKRRRQGALLAFAIGGGAIVSGLLKHAYDRARPDIVPHLVPVSSASFPSGHAMNSAIVYLTIAALVARSYKEPATRYFIVLLAVLLTGLIGTTRVFLGVHWPSDVIAGWLVGAAWALAMGMLGSLLQKQRKIEQPAQAQGEAPDARLEPILAKSGPPPSR